MARPPIERKDPTSDPSASWLGIPAVYCDTFTTIISQDSKTVRIVFGDYVSREYVPFYRYAVVMPIADVKALVRNLSRRIQELEEKEAEQEGEEHPSEE